MKKLFTVLVLIILSFDIKIIAQKVILGVASQNASSELLSTDPITGNQHYRGTTFPMKKGQACLIFMSSANFKPRVAIASSSGMIAPVSGKETDSLAEITWIAPVDTSVVVYFTSVENNKTGKFNYGFRLIDSSQIIFKDDYSTCDRLTYLINHWQMDWMLVPTEIKHGIYKTFPYVNSDYYSFKNTLLSTSGSVYIDKYQEKMFSMPEDADQAKEKTIEFYKKIRTDIKSCLDNNKWTIETDLIGEFQLSGTTYGDMALPITTNFILKGAVKDQKLQSFKIVMNPPFIKRPYEVLLIFN